MSRREQIRMDPAEVRRFLAQERTVTCGTLGPRGWPHLMPLTYALRRSADGAPELWAWTYAASQKVRNLQRDHRATLQVEAGESYEELRGVMLECETVLHRDLETVQAVGFEVLARMVPRGQPPLTRLPEQTLQMVYAQAPKRLAMQFVERRRATWDHRKLGGVY